MRSKLVHLMFLSVAFAGAASLGAQTGWHVTKTFHVGGEVAGIT